MRKWSIAIVIVICIIFGAIAYIVYNIRRVEPVDIDDILGDNNKRPAEYIGLQRGVRYINIKKIVTHDTQDNSPFVAIILSAVLYDAIRQPINIPRQLVTITGFHADGRELYRRNIAFDAGQEPVRIDIDADLMVQLDIIDIEYDMLQTFEISRVTLTASNSALTGCRYTISGPDDPYIFSGVLGRGPEYILFEAAEKKRSGFCGNCLSAY